MAKKIFWWALSIFVILGVAGNLIKSNKSSEKSISSNVSKNDDAFCKTLNVKGMQAKVINGEWAFSVPENDIHTLIQNGNASATGEYIRVNDKTCAVKVRVSGNVRGNSINKEIYLMANSN